MVAVLETRMKWEVLKSSFAIIPVVFLCNRRSRNDRSIYPSTSITNALRWRLRNLASIEYGCDE